MIAALRAYDRRGKTCHEDTRDYPDLSLLWEHDGAQQNNRKTVRVRVMTETGLQYEVSFSPWTPERRYSPSARFVALLESWASEDKARDAQACGKIASEYLGLL